jgi:ABC-type uncharacterized transport system substrate-binding protein
LATTAAAANRTPQLTAAESFAAAATAADGVRGGDIGVSAGKVLVRILWRQHRGLGS